MTVEKTCRNCQFCRPVGFDEWQCENNHMVRGPFTLDKECLDDTRSVCRYWKQKDYLKGVRDD
jgi:hypothetical protein